MTTGAHNLALLAEESFERHGDYKALFFEGTWHTTGELRDRTHRLASGFTELGIEPGDRVAVQAPNTHHWVLAALGALHAGATLVPVGTRLTGHEALDIVQRSRARALVVAGPFLGVDRLAQLREAAGPEGLPDLRLVLRVPTGDAMPAAAGAVEWHEV